MFLFFDLLSKVAVVCLFYVEKNFFFILCVLRTIEKTHMSFPRRFGKEFAKGLGGQWLP